MPARRMARPSRWSNPLAAPSPRAHPLALGETSSESQFGGTAPEPVVKPLDGAIAASHPLALGETSSESQFGGTALS